MKITEITQSNFATEIESSDIPVLVEFWAPWCGPCKMQAPVLEQLADEVEGAKIAKINIDEEQQLAQKFGVMSIPTLCVFKDGKEVDRMVGLQSKAALASKLG